MKLSKSLRLISKKQSVFRTSLIKMPEDNTDSERINILDIDEIASLILK
jgi:hypothetical protein